MIIIVIFHLRNIDIVRIKLMEKSLYTFFWHSFIEANFSVSEVAQMMSWKYVLWQPDSRNGSPNFSNSSTNLKREIQLLEFEKSILNNV